MIQNADPTGYSAKVRLWLEYENRIVTLSHVGPDMVIPDKPQRLSPCAAEVVVEVDGQEHRASVFLPHGMSPDSVRVPVQRRDAIKA